MHISRLECLGKVPVGTYDLGERMSLNNTSSLVESDECPDSDAAPDTLRVKSDVPGTPRPKLTRKSAIDLASEDSSVGPPPASKIIKYYTIEDSSSVAAVNQPSLLQRSLSEVPVDQAKESHRQVTQLKSLHSARSSSPEHFTYEKSPRDEYEKIDMASNENVTVEIKSEPIELGEIIRRVPQPANAEDGEKEEEDGRHIGDY